ncbi:MULTISPECIES: hypothetical protein [Shewanella]|uniref:hypothetical protein n=1 Tax=Shewanella TaxID=22 RepID=UPI000C691EF8|nr:MULTISPECIES: hypothetical protein [Shewanella]NCQ43471.1 hypothetical protein [Shewanella frigidimarina]NCO73519.1 hypothetical protein [Shewanella vesiculosa]NCP38705.1 hypothetical protein [Shewanella vesiculosa]NCP71757.1 hypothetical protein [Shewanella vesiculosa]NCQ01544.1 hypothetical protein [Shewanella vesiculosa]
MCSSPKSSRPVSVSKPIKAFGEGLTKEQRLNFTEVANRADERRQQRLEAKRRWEQKHNITKSKQQHSSVWQWLNNFFASFATR